MRQIVDFYETAVSQPLIPGTVLRYTDEILRFEPVGSFAAMGNLGEPHGQFLIIDGQHRLAALCSFSSPIRSLSSTWLSPKDCGTERLPSFATMDGNNGMRNVGGTALVS